MMMTIGQRLATARQHSELTQNDVAAVLHVTRQTISSWETERTYPDITSLVALAELYHLSLDNLIREDKDMIKAWQDKEAALRDAGIMFRVSLLLDIGFILFLVAEQLAVPGFSTSHGLSLLLVLMTFTNVLSLPRVGRYYRALRGTMKKRNHWAPTLLVLGLVGLIGVLKWTACPYSPVIIAAGYAGAMVLLFWPYFKRR
ncbi:helix-turn-helix transcriptional regulator [Schleiferilactobacillus harbinensis]|uniref:helix-turn-helix transcriptional regulator n=1 Tax=Schleiferilactobacillus harbinensis TaxID=304207 RepID=UPI001CC27451|nr:helix-turn-helix transcriptional regulator [Schleiferilactobacillus harbinensis]